MSYILQVDFKMDGPFGEEMAIGFKDLAESINNEPGFLWKIWTENAEAGEAGGIYYFDTQENAAAYLEMHSKRLNGFGIVDINSKVFAVNEALSNINKGPINV